MALIIVLVREVKETHIFLLFRVFFMVLGRPLRKLLRLMAFSLVLFVLVLFRLLATRYRLIARRDVVLSLVYWRTMGVVRGICGELLLLISCRSLVRYFHVTALMLLLHRPAKFRILVLLIPVLSLLQVVIDCRSKFLRKSRTKMRTIGRQWRLWRGPRVWSRFLCWQWSHRSKLVGTPLLFMCHLTEKVFWEWRHPITMTFLILVISVPLLLLIGRRSILIFIRLLTSGSGERLRRLFLMGGDIIRLRVMMIMLIRRLLSGVTLLILIWRRFGDRPG